VIARAAADASGPARLPRKRSTLLRVGGLVFIADQITKLFVLMLLAPGERMPLVGRSLALHHMTNPGSALGFQADRPWLVIALALGSAGLLALLMYFLPKARQGRLLAASLALGGAAGNLFDRIRGPGVVDFVEVRVGPWILPVFNVADVAIMVGAVWLAASIWWDERALS